MKKILAFLSLLLVCFALPYQARAWNYNNNIDPPKIVLHFNNNVKGDHEMTYDSTNKLWKFEFTSTLPDVNFTVRSYYSGGYHEYYANQGVSSANKWSLPQNNPQDKNTSFYLSGMTSGTKYRIELKGSSSDVNQFIFRYVPTETHPSTETIKTPIYITYSIGKNNWKYNQVVNMDDNGTTFNFGTVAKDTKVYFLVQTASANTDDFWKNVHGTNKIFAPSDFRNIDKDVSSGSTLKYYTSNFNNGALTITGKGANVSITLKPAKTSTGGFYDLTLTPTIEDPSVAPAYTKMNLPLKPADFDNDTKHYFLVGTRIGDWRLQPEWELKDQGNGTYAIATPRVMYQGRVGIAEVTSYDNYKNGIYTLHYADNYWIKKDAHNPTMSSTKSIDYYATTFKNNGVLATLFLADKEDNFTKDNIMKSKGVVISKITYDASSKICDFTYSSDPVSKYITFSLVGSNIMNANLPDNDKTQRSTKFGKSAMNYWQDAWVQYDENGVPYRDAKGTLFYQTVFQNDWLEKHPTKFNLNLDGGRQFDYASRNVVMVNTKAMSAKELAEDPYAPLYKRFEKQGNNNLGKVDGKDQSVTIHDDDNNIVYTYKEWMDMYGNNPQGIGRSAKKWECYVVKDMWMDGSFKVWTGWGGGIKETENSGAEGPENARWYYVNGGHGVKKTQYPIKGYDITSTKADEVIAIYGTKRDVDGADFKVSDGGKPVYFKRVIVWYDPSEEDFDNSAIQLIIEKCGPNIKAFRNSSDGSAVDYSWNVPQDGLTDQEKDQEVTHATITLQRWDGSKWVDVKVVYDADPDPATIGDCTGTDDSTNDLPGGTYRYTIDLTYKDASNSNALLTRSAVSNEITLYDASAPVVAKASQRTEEINGDTYYSFDLVLDLKLTDATLEAKYGDNDELDIFDLAEAYYVNCTDDALVTRINAGTTDSSLQFTDGNKSVYNPTSNKIDEINGNWIEVPFTSKSDVAKSLQWSNVAVGSGKDYPFTVYLKYKETNKDKFALVRFEPTKASMQFVIPQMGLDAQSSVVETVDAPENYSTPEEAMPLGSHNLAVQAQPIHYTKFNNLKAEFKVVAPKVTQSVLDNYDLDYAVTADNRALSVDATGTATVNYLEPNNKEIQKTTTARMKNVFYEAIAGGKCDATGKLTYNRKDNNTAYTVGTPEVTASQKLASPVLDTPEVTISSSKLSTYENSVKEGTDRYIVHDAYAELSVTDNNLGKVHTLGYHVWGNYPDVVLEATPSTKAHNGGVVIDSNLAAAKNYICETALADYTPYTDGWNEANNWAGKALSAKKLPVYVEHFSAHKMADSENTTDGNDNQIHAIVSYHYPFLVANTSAVAGASMKAPKAADNFRVVNLTTYTTIANATVSNVATGIGEVNADEIEGAVFYNLQGIRVANPERGQIYIMTTAAGARKIRF